MTYFLKHFLICFVLYGSIEIKAQFISTVAGSGGNSSQSDIPEGSVAINTEIGYVTAHTSDNLGNIYFASNHTIYKISAQGIISRLTAYNFYGSYTGDGGSAINATFNSPESLVIDNVGNILIADTGNHRIRKISNLGIVSTIAGQGQQGYSGDGADALMAKLSEPREVMADSSGNIYISDSGNHRIRKINLAGEIITIAGTGVAGYSGDGSLAITAQINSPIGLAYKDNTLYFADHLNNRIRSINSSGYINTFAGNPNTYIQYSQMPALNASFNYPLRLAADNSGNLYVSDGYAKMLRRIDSNGIVFNLVENHGADFENGPAIVGGFQTPRSISILPNGDILITDGYRIRKISADLDGKCASGFFHHDTAAPSTLEMCAGGLPTIATSNGQNWTWGCLGAGNGKNTTSDACSTPKAYTLSMASSTKGTIRCNNNPKKSS